MDAHCSLQSREQWASMFRENRRYSANMGVLACLGSESGQLEVLPTRSRVQSEESWAGIGSRRRHRERVKGLAWGFQADRRPFPRSRKDSTRKFNEWPIGDLAAQDESAVAGGAVGPLVPTTPTKGRRCLTKGWWRRLVWTERSRLSNPNQGVRTSGRRVGILDLGQSRRFPSRPGLH